MRGRAEVVVCKDLRHNDIDLALLQAEAKMLFQTSALGMGGSSVVKQAWYVQADHTNNLHDGGRHVAVVTTTFGLEEFQCCACS